MAKSPSDNPASNTVVSPVEPEVPLAPQIPVIDADQLVNTGKTFAFGVTPSSTAADLTQRRVRAEKFATSIVDRQIIDGDAVSTEEITCLSDTWKTEREQVPPFRNDWLQAEKELATLQRERGQLGAAPEEPHVWKFLLFGAFLGLIFGLIASLTTGEVLWAVFYSDIEENPALKDTLFHFGIALSVFAGLVIGTMTIMVRRWAVTGSWFVRWGAFLMGLLFAIGLGGFRMLRETPTGVQFQVTAAAVVLLAVEIALLVGIEVLDSVLLAAWKSFHENGLAIRTKESEIAAATTNRDNRQQALRREESEERQAWQTLQRRLAQKRAAALMREEKADYIAECREHVMRGFDVEVSRLMTQ